MFKHRFILLFLSILVVTFVRSQNTISFLKNKGQWHSNANYKAELKGGFLYLEKQRLTFNLYDTKKVNQLSHNHNPTENQASTQLNWHAYNVDFLNSNSNVKFIEKDSTIAYFNYFLGNNKAKWAANVRGYKQITYQNIYEGIDFVMYSAEELKYDFIVRPNANINSILLQYNGVDKLEVKNGRLIITTSVNTITEEKPYAYQLINGKKIEIACNYALKNNQLSFEFPNGYDKSKELIIDPTLIFSAFSGSFSNNFGYSATFDSKGFLYSGSSAFGNAYPTTLGAYSTTFNGGGDDIAISKFDTSGTFLIYSTFIGGNNAELPHSLIVNSFDEVFILGSTSSPNYPTTANAFDTTFNGGTAVTLSGLGVSYTNGSDIVLTRLSTGGNQLLASTFVGGSQNDGLNSTAAANSPNNKLKYNYADEVRGEIDIDINNNIYVVSCTRSPNFPIVGNVFQSNYGGGNIDACVFKLDNNLQNMIWSSFLGGNDHDAAFSLAIDNNEDLYLTGGTNSPNFPITPNGLQTTFNGGRADGFIAKIAKNGSQILDASYYGSTTYDQTYFVELDKQNNVYVLGQTEIQNNTFIQNALWSVPGSGQFISKLTPEIDSVIYSTVFGSGNGINISPTAFLVDLCNKIYLTGWGGTVNQGSVSNNAGNTNNMPITPNAFQSTTDGSDFYIMVMEDDASNINYGSYFGGPISAEHVDGGTSRFDRKGKIYQAICAGCGGNSDLPIAPPTNPFNVNNNSCNLGIFKMDFDLPVVVADFDVPPIGCAPFSFTFNNTSLTQSNTMFNWNFGDGSPNSTQFSPSHTYTNPGTYTVTLIVSDTLTCNLGDTIQKDILIIGNNNSNLAAINICPGQTEQIGVLPNADPSITYTWTPSNGLSDTTISNPFASPTTTTIYQLFISNGICIDTLTQVVNVNTPLLSVPNDTILCFNETALLAANSFGTSSTFIWSSNNQFSDTLNSPITSNSITTTPNLSAFYYVSINNNGCELTDSVAVFAIGEGSVTINSFICVGDTVTISYSNTNSGFNTNYNWSPSAQIISGNGTPTIVVAPNSTTTYTIIATNDICIDTLSHTVNVTSPQLSISNDTVICLQGDTTTLFASSTATGSSIIWSSSPTFNDTLNAPFQDTISVSPSSPSYFYVLLNANGCIIVDSVFVGIATSQTSVQNVSICVGDTIALTIINLNPFDSLFHDWQPNNEIISGDSTNTILVSPTSTTTFFVISENSAGCIIWDSITVTVDNLGNLPVSATADNPNLYMGESTTLHALPNGFTYLWSPSSGLNNSNSQNPIATPTQTTTYTVTIQGQNCSKTASVTVFVNEIVCGEPDIFIPNAFTPNNDGENDVLFVRGRLVEKMELKIFNRWGELVFESSNQTNGWDGTYKGELVQPNVFVYYLKVYCVDGQEYFKKGNVTVIR